MFKIKLFFLLPFMFSSVHNITGEAVLKKMYDRYHNKWYHNLTFDQDTKRYHNDSLKSEEVWHEALLLPDLFRIDMGAKSNGNGVIFKSDSAYRFKNGNLVSVKYYENDLLFLLGGMYFYKFDEVLKKVKHFGYDISKGHEDTWKGRKVYVLGSDNSNENINQLWIDAKDLYVVRMINYHGAEKEESLFEDHLAQGGGYTETTSIFYIDNKMLQYEKYHHCMTNIKLDRAIFDPGKYTSTYWY